MLSHSFYVVISIAFLLYPTVAQDIPLPIHVTTSSNHYGPDGPWQAVSVSYGSPPQDIDLYPGSAFESIVLTRSVCDDVSLTPCGSGGLFDPEDSSDLDDSSIQYGEHNDGFMIDWTLGALRLGGQAHFALDQLTLHAQQSKIIPNLSTRLIYNASITYPDGTEYPPQLGQLALGSSLVNQSFTTGEGLPSINASLVPGYLWANKVIPSSSYGLHIGSAALGLPLSLWVGGYDQSRVLGSVSSQSYDSQYNFFAIDLLDIGIGVDHGGSPFSYSARENILAEGNSSMPKTLSVAMNPAAPYLVLPQSTCAAIAKDLPVTFNAKYGLYFWDVDDPQYSRIVTSPSYLSFTFRASGISNVNLTINVPFQLLNLTLDAPLIKKPTPYFPCQPPQLTEQYSLGRAFLQAAFLGVDWNQGLGKWFLAQAPGPNTGSTPSAAPYPDAFTKSSTSANKWSDTWDGHWTPLPENTPAKKPTKSSAAELPGTSNSGTPEKARANVANGAVTTGAKVGIGVGIAALVIIAIGAIFFFFRRRRARRVMAPLPAWRQTGYQDESKHGQPSTIHEAPGQQPSELYTGDAAHELHGDHVRGLN